MNRGRLVFSCPSMKAWTSTGFTAPLAPRCPRGKDDELPGSYAGSHAKKVRGTPPKSSLDRLAEKLENRSALDVLPIFSAYDLPHARSAYPELCRQGSTCDGTRIVKLADLQNFLDGQFRKALSLSFYNPIRSGSRTMAITSSPPLWASVRTVSMPPCQNLRTKPSRMRVSVKFGSITKSVRFILADRP